MSFFDTNVMVAAAIPTHPHHMACNARLAKLRLTGGSCSVHSLAETYSTLTHVSRYRVLPADASRFVAGISLIFTVVVLSAKEYMRTIQMASDLGLQGPIIYDALLIACARKIDARWIYTKNVRHFQQVAPDLAARIVEP